MLKHWTRRTCVAMGLLAASTCAHSAQFEVSFTPKGETYIGITGKLVEGDGETFNKLFTFYKEKGRATRQVWLDLTGGDAEAHFKIVRKILHEDMDTVVNKGATCTAACVTLLVAGHHRTIDPDSTIGVNRAGYKGDSENDATKEVTQGVASLYGLLGVSQSIIDKMLASSPKEMYYLTKAEKEQLSISPEEWVGTEINIGLADD